MSFPDMKSIWSFAPSRICFAANLDLFWKWLKRMVFFVGKSSMILRRKEGARPHIQFATCV